MLGPKGQWENIIKVYSPSISLVLNVRVGVWGKKLTLEVKSSTLREGDNPNTNHYIHFLERRGILGKEAHKSLVSLVKRPSSLGILKP